MNQAETYVPQTQPVSAPPPDQAIPRLYRWALILAFITVGYNLIEGIVSVWFGFNDETLALFGFGLDSFIEVLSGIGIVHMVMRLRQNPSAKDRDKFETTALRITGFESGLRAFAHGPCFNIIKDRSLYARTEKN